MEKILFVEDDKDYRLFLKELLILNDYHVTEVASAIEGLEKFKQHSFDLIISDLKMASIDGLQFLYLIREMDENIKVILLTSSEDEEDEYRGLDLQVNDYIKKTTSLKVLLKRIEKVLRESVVREQASLVSVAEDLVVELKTRKTFKDGVLVPLTQKEFEILVYFMENKNAVLSREKILKKVWQTNQDLSDMRMIDTHVKNIRAKLQLTCIFSIRGVGYEWSE